MRDPAVRWHWVMAIAFGALLGLYLGAWLMAAPQGFSVTGPLRATVQEAQEGYYSLGNELAIVTKPGSPIHDDLQRMVDLNVTVVVEAR